MTSVQLNLDKTTIPDRDELVRERWNTQSMPPRVFIMGLHRSGTTFLYESLARLLPVAKVTIRDVVFYRQLVHSHMTDKGEADREMINSYFAGHKLTARLRDDIRLSAETAEEYGWCLRRSAGNFELNVKTLPTFRDLCRKLSYIHPQSKAILLKNPWDTANAGQIARMIADARFVFIRRNPLEILNSELCNVLAVTDRKQPLLSLLTNGIIEKKVLIGSLRLFRKCTGRRFFLSTMTKMLFSDITKNLQAYESALQQISPDRAIEISYRQLVEDTPKTLLAIADFLALAPSADIEISQAERRPGKMLSVVIERQQNLVRKLKEANLESFLDA